MKLYMDLLNLNIEAYNDSELEEMLSLTYPYREEDIVLQKNDLYKPNNEVNAEKTLKN